MDLPLDRSTAVRAGEDLPVSQLEAFLRKHLPDVSGSLTVEQFPHGHSNLTYLLRLGDAEFVLRRPPFGNQVQTAHDMSREYRVLSKLSAEFPPAPKPYLYCEDVSVIGAPFYVMQRRHGVVLRKSLPRGVALDPETMRNLSIALIDNLAQLHAVDYVAAGLSELGKPAGYVTRQVTGWINRYANARTDDAAAMETVTRWLTEQMPSEAGTAVIHNDYKFDNLLLDPDNLTHIVAVLDWEMATLGDPLMDLGTTLGYWIESGDADPLKAAAMGPTALPGALTRRELVDRYESTTGREVRNPVFYYCFGLFKISVIIQQIYARFVRGHTADPRFAHLNQLVAVLSQQAERVMETGKI